MLKTTFADSARGETKKARTRARLMDAAALVIAPAASGAAARGARFEATLASGASTAVPLRSAAARALAGNAMADALPFLETLALGSTGRLELPLSRSLALRLDS